MAGIRVRDHENFESAMRRFKRVVEKSGILSEMRKREHFEKKCDKRKRAMAAAVKRFRKKQLREVRPSESRTERTSSSASSSSSTRH